MDEETSSIDKSVREVVKAHVEEVVTEMVDQKVADTVVEMKDELTKEKLVELLTGDAIKEVLSETNLDHGNITAAEISELDDAIADAVTDKLGDTDFTDYGMATVDYVDEQISYHSHDSYDTWSDIESYAEDMVDSKLNDHINEHAHGGGAGKLQKNFESVLNLIGVTKSGDMMMVTNSPSGWAHKPDGPNTILARIKKLEDMVDSKTPISSNGADPRIDQLMAWAQHVDNILKAAAESTVLNQEVPA